MKVEGFCIHGKGWYAARRPAEVDFFEQALFGFFAETWRWRANYYDYDS